eukprot:3094100-Amphidinium_carterae.1
MGSKATSMDAAKGAFEDTSIEVITPEVETEMQELMEKGSIPTTTAARSLQSQHWGSIRCSSSP